MPSKQLLLSLSLAILSLSFPTLLSASGAVDSYSYKGGDWPDSCASGVQQSPIDIPLSQLHAAATTHQMTTTQYHTSSSATSSDASHRRVLSSSEHVTVPTFTPVPYLKFLTSTSTLSNTSVSNLLDTIQVDYKDGTLAFWDETNYMKLYNMLQLHVHAPSEHTFDGHNYDLEVHVVFQSYDQTELSVVGFFFDTEAGGDKENDFVNALRFNATTATWTSPSIPLQEVLKKLD